MTDVALYKLLEILFLCVCTREARKPYFQKHVRKCFASFFENEICLYLCQMRHALVAKQYGGQELRQASPAFVPNPSRVSFVSK